MSAVPRTTIAPTPRDHRDEFRDGDRLSREEFHRRYLRMPHIRKAELIEGVVHMPSPVRCSLHGSPDAFLIGWLAYYCSKTPGLQPAANATVKLDDDNEFQPDALLLIPAHAGGTSRLDDGDYIVGAPDLVAEISGSTVKVDLGEKLDAYRRNGVREYLVWRVEDRAIDYFMLKDGQFVRQMPTSNICKSEVFPGLWLDVNAMLAGNLAGVLAAVDRGIAASDHAAFAQRVKPA